MTVDRGSILEQTLAVVLAVGRDYPPTAPLLQSLLVPRTLVLVVDVGEGKVGGGGGGVVLVV